MMRYISCLVSLRKLNLSRSPITDVGLIYVSNLICLNNINVSFCKWITDKGLYYLNGLINLKSINIINCDITYKGLSNLINLTNLQKIKCFSLDDEGIY